MDGWEATRRIRQIAPDLPVIGLTAHVLDESEQRRLDSGMVESLTKPIDDNALVAAILRHRASATPAPAPAADDETVAVEPESRGKIDWRALDARFKGNSAMVLQFVQTILKSHGDTPSRLRRLAAARDCPALAFLAHDLKSTAGYLEAQKLSELAQETEAAAREDGKNTIDLAEMLASEMTGMIDELTEFAIRSP